MRVIDTGERREKRPAAGAEGTPLYIPLQGDPIPTSQPAENRPARLMGNDVTPSRKRTTAPPSMMARHRQAFVGWQGRRRLSRLRSRERGSRMIVIILSH